ncbi:monovalent cation/H(+) antiporter subunit G [Priestia koreensis]|uniref:monovalent cation/H(+) antiporter subunit G n=1 Tax=Priestia koreensis TaxID=284581 RepID=UPI001F586871|nr:monovalent cation/H(+) antiporter subunit G [Priestia koreensis]MCM3004402.1 monovalent cation/H(+) antiporter subunit G [Priestia koreensis]UNL84618.1 Na+/H+ antiporter subunit G [Priestia koreensis]
MIEIVKYIAVIIILIGALLSLVTTIGLFRLPDTYTRSHAASKSATLGIMAVLSGTALFFWVDKGFLSGRLILGIIFIFVTSPVAGHLIARAAYKTNVPLWEKTVHDDLKGKYDEQEKERRGEQFDS